VLAAGCGGRHREDDAVAPTGAGAPYGAGVLTTVIAAESAVFGAIAGSIGSSAAYRVPRHLSMFTTQRSRCDCCGTALRWVDLVPVLSWFWLGARCHWCGAPISPTYARVELAAACACSALAMAVLGAGPAATAVVVGGLGALALSEWRWRATRERDPGPDR
jgi:prepilin signal peptidase PulO-like enzyme (type II secretory pathway)